MREVGERLFDARAQIQDVGADLLRDAQRDRLAAVAGDEQRTVGGAGADASQISDADGCPFFDDDGRGCDLIDAGPETRGQRKMLLPRFGESPDRCQQILALQFV